MFWEHVKKFQVPVYLFFFKKPGKNLLCCDVKLLS